MEKLTMIIWHSPDYCINCKSNSLRVVTDKGHSTSVLEVDMSNKFKIYKKIVCSKCGTELEEGQKFCFECGTPAPQLKKCINAG